jgi:hypothetical protein
MIINRNQAYFHKVLLRGLQEVIRGQTPHIILKMESWLIKELLGHTPKTDDSPTYLRSKIALNVNDNC